jgi:thiamine biosynthesis lipoprotein
MGTRLRLLVESGDRAAALAAGERALAALEATEARLSTWTSSSELARLNAAPPSVPLPLSSALAAELAAALRCAAATGGAFDPTVGALVDAWGLRGDGRVPSADDLTAARAATGSHLLGLGSGAAERRHPGLRIEEGGFGKGAGLDAAMAEITAIPALAGEAPFARLDLGGQIALAGAPRETEILVADPDDRERPAVAVRIATGSLATSGNGPRGLTVDGRRIGHLLDPRTGEPAPDFGSLTVWAPTALLADCLSTGLFVLGPEGTLAFARRRPEIGVLVLERRSGGLLAARVGGALAARSDLVRALAPRVRVERDTAGSATARTDPSTSEGSSLR